MERTLNPKKDFSRFVDRLNKKYEGARKYTVAYKDGLLTLEEYIHAMFEYEKEMIIRGE